MEPAQAFARAFDDVRRDLRGFLRESNGVPTAALTVKFARIQATLADDLRATLDIEPFAREKVVMTTLAAFRKALATAGLVDEDTSLHLAEEAVTKVALRVVAADDDAEHADVRKQAADDLSAKGETLWRWKARLDTRTCLFCLWMHGKTFPIGTQMDSHPNCRCVPVSPNRPYAMGEDWLAKRSEDALHRIMGPTRAQAYIDGVPLSALVDPARRSARRVRDMGRRDLGEFDRPVIRGIDPDKAAQAILMARRRAERAKAIEAKRKGRKTLIGTQVAEAVKRDVAKRRLSWRDEDNLADAWGLTPEEVFDILQRRKGRRTLPLDWEHHVWLPGQYPEVNDPTITAMLREFVPVIFRKLARLFPSLTCNWNGRIDVTTDISFGAVAQKPFTCSIAITPQMFHEGISLGPTEPDLDGRARVRVAWTLFHEFCHAFSAQSAPDAYVDDVMRERRMEEGLAHWVSLHLGRDGTIARLSGVNQDDVDTYVTELIAHHSYTPYLTDLSLIGWALQVTPEAFLEDLLGVRRGERWSYLFDRILTIQDKENRKAAVRALDRLVSEDEDAYPEQDTYLRVIVPASAAEPGTDAKTTRIAQPSGTWVRGTVITADDPRIPDIVYHVTTNLPAVRESGMLLAGGVGGLGGDPSDQVVSMTIDRDIAVQLEADIRLNAIVMKLTPDEAFARLTAEARSEGWADEWLGQPFVEDGRMLRRSDGEPWYGPHDLLSTYFSARSRPTGKRNPLFFFEYGRDVDPNKVGLVEIRKADLDNGALLTDFDLDNPYGLQEIRCYGDVVVR